MNGGFFLRKADDPNACSGVGWGFGVSWSFHHRSILLIDASTLCEQNHHLIGFTHLAIKSKYLPMAS